MKQTLRLVVLHSSLEMAKLEIYFETEVDIPRIRVGKKQTLETLINEEALVFAKYLRQERQIWTPRISF